MPKATCSFTGHRPQKLPFKSNEADPRCIALKAKLKVEIERQIVENHVTHFISGMALGVDTFAAELVLELKEKYPIVTLEAAIPCKTQAAKWSKKAGERYRSILARCDKVTYVSREYTADCMQRRNRYMVDSSDIVIAVWNGSPSGTGKTVEYAKAQGKSVVLIESDEGGL